jgi:hypothetical protein
MSLNTYANSISLSARGYDDNNSILNTSTTVLTDELFGFDTANVTEIQWSATDVDGFKNFFDDFNFNLTAVPEPGSAVLVLLAGLVGMRRRRSV